MKKIILFLFTAVLLTSCSKVGKGEYIITGTAKGIENGKTVILETQNEKGLVAIDTVKVQNGKFEIKGKVTEPAFHTLQLQAVAGKIPFILESGEIAIVVDKDSIQKSKISGTYNNDEFVKFNEEMKVVQKDLIDFQKKNMETMTKAQQTNDTSVINSLMEEYNKIQQKVAEVSKTKYITYAETHPKSLISALIIQGMSNDPSVDIKKTEKIYESFDSALKETKPGKAIKAKIDQMKKTPSTGAATAAPAGGDAK